MTGRLAGKVALITGGARGQGASHGRILAEEGAKVLLVDVRDDAGEEMVASLRADGLDVRYHHLDVTRIEDWDKAVAFAEKTFGKLDVLVNNAAITGNRSPVDDCPIEEWNAVIAVNQTGVFLGMQRVAPAMRRAGGGSIINISSVMGSRGMEFSIAYSAAKGAVHMLTRASAVMLAPLIRVNSVTPGMIQSEMSDALQSQHPDRYRDFIGAYALARIGQPDEVSKAVVFLASDESTFTTGADIPVDGGALAGMRQRKSN